MKIIKTLSLSLLLTLGTTFAQFAEPPTSVENVIATPGNGQITLTWDEAEDSDGVVIGYKIYYGANSVQTEDDYYDDEIFASDTTQLTIEDLENGTEYFFAVTGVDDEENESETYSLEVSATPIAEEAPEATPEPEVIPEPEPIEPLVQEIPEPQGPVFSENLRIVSATNPTPNKIEVQMSEAVVFSNSQNAFEIKNQTGETIEITNIFSSNQLVTVETAQSLIFRENYTVNALDGVEDFASQKVSLTGNSIQFTAQGTVPELAAGEFPEKPANLPEAEPEFAQEELEIMTMIPEPEAVEQEHAAAPVDEVAPLDATSFKVNSSLLQSDGIIILSWKPAMDIDEDILDQVLYTKEGTGQYDNGYSIGKELFEIELEVKLNKTYEIKLITMDKSGNESEGTSVTFTTVLAKSGPNELGSVIALMLIAISGLWYFRERLTLALRK